MALHGNMDVFHKNPGRSLSGQSLFGNRPQSNKGGSMRNVFSGDYDQGFDEKSSIALGYTPPYCYMIAMKGGGMASFQYVTGAGDITLGRLVGGRNISSALSGSGNITNAAGALVVTAIAALVGTGTVTASMVGIATATANLLGTGNVTAALGALGKLTAAIIGTGTVTTSITATGFMTADIGGSGDAVTPASVAAASYNTAGTMGAKLNAAGGAADPWATALPGAYGAGTAGSIIGNNLDVAVSTLSTSTQAALILKILRNKTATDPATGIMTVYDDNGTDVLFTANIYQDVAAVTPYDGNGINLKDRLT